MKARTYTQVVWHLGTRLVCDYEIFDGDVILCSVRHGGEDISELLEPGSNLWLGINGALIEAIDEQRKADMEDIASARAEERRCGLYA